MIHLVLPGPSTFYLKQVEAGLKSRTLNLPFHFHSLKFCQCQSAAHIYTQGNQGPQKTRGWSGGPYPGLKSKLWLLAQYLFTIISEPWGLCTDDLPLSTSLLCPLPIHSGPGLCALNYPGLPATAYISGTPGDIRDQPALQSLQNQGGSSLLSHTQEPKLPGRKNAKKESQQPFFHPPHHPAFLSWASASPAGLLHHGGIVSSTKTKQRSKGNF